MISESSARDRERRGDNETPDRDRDDCDPRLVDCLKCKAAGIAAQADYNSQHQPELEAAQTTYDTTRKTYRDARGGVALQVQDMRHQIKHLIERIKCLIKQKRVVECIDEAYLLVVAQLDECGYPEGCCADDECEFDTDCGDLDYDELVKRITRYQAHADRAKACFTKLVTEPTELVKRVAACKAEVDAINAALGAEPANTDLKKVYAQAKVARRHIGHIWNGFDETRDFVECLCRALTCWTKGCAAVSVLTGAQAVADCEQKANDARCTNLHDNTVDEIITVYERICPHPSCDDSDDGDADDGDSDDRENSDDRDSDDRENFDVGEPSRRTRRADDARSRRD